MLTSKQAKFVASYQITGNPTESAKNAGYSEKNAASQGCRLMKDPEVLAELELFRQKKAQSITKEDFIDKALRDYESVDVVEPNRARFLELAGKGAGIIGGSEIGKTQNLTINQQINISGNEAQPEIWELTRKLLGNE